LKFSGFHTYGEALTHKGISPSSGSLGDTLSLNGEFTDFAFEIVFADEIPDSDPFSTGAVISTFDELDVPSWSGDYTVMALEEYFLDFSDNTVLFREDREISGILIEAVKNGSIKSVYSDKWLSDPIDMVDFTRRITIPDLEMEELFREVYEWDEQQHYMVSDKARISNVIYESLADFNKGNHPSTSAGFWVGELMTIDTVYYLPMEFTTMHVVYNTTFDDLGEIKSINPMAIQFYISAENTGDEIDIYTGYMKYEECEAVLRASDEAQIEDDGKNYADVIENKDLLGFTLYSGNVQYVK